MSKKKKNTNNVYYPYDGDNWNEMSPIRTPFESDEDWRERIESIYGEDALF